MLFLLVIGIGNDSKKGVNPQIFLILFWKVIFSKYIPEEIDEQNQSDIGNEEVAIDNLIWCTIY